MVKSEHQLQYNEIKLMDVIFYTFVIFIIFIFIYLLFIVLPSKYIKNEKVNTIINTYDELIDRSKELNQLLFREIDRMNNRHDTELVFHTIDYKLFPSKGTPQSAGFDIKFPEDILVKPNTTITINTGVYMEIPDGYVGLVYPRSSFGIKHGMSLKNTVGVIDSDYRGELILMLEFNINNDIQFKKYDRFAQIVFVPHFSNSDKTNNVYYHNHDNVDNLKNELSNTLRGDGAFGSTN